MKLKNLFRKRNGKNKEERLVVDFTFMVKGEGSQRSRAGGAEALMWKRDCGGGGFVWVV